MTLPTKMAVPEIVGTFEVGSFMFAVRFADPELGDRYVLTKEADIVSVVAEAQEEFGEVTAITKLCQVIEVKGDHVRYRDVTSGTVGGFTMEPVLPN